VVQVYLINDRTVQVYVADTKCVEGEAINRPRDWDEVHLPISAYRRMCLLVGDRVTLEMEKSQMDTEGTP